MKKTIYVYKITAEDDELFSGTQLPNGSWYNSQIDSEGNIIISEEEQAVILEHLDIDIGELIPFNPKIEEHEE